MSWLWRARTSLFTVVIVVGMAAAPAAAAPRPRTGGLSGTVLGVSGAPLTGAAVTAYALPGLQAGCLVSGNEYRAVRSVTTDSTGAFALPLPTGRYRIGVRPAAVDLATDSGGFWVDAGKAQFDGSNVTSWVGFADDVMVPSNGRTGLAVKVTEPVSITGRFTDPTPGVPAGTPLSGIEVRAVQVGPDQLTRVYPAAFTDSNGDYAIRGLPAFVADPIPETPTNEALVYGLVAVDPAAWHGILVWWHTLLDDDPSNPEFYDPDNNVPLVDFNHESETGVRNVNFAGMAASGRVAGKVVNERGRPIAGIEVSVDSDSPWPPGTVTDRRGGFVIPAGAPLRFIDPAGKYREAWYPGVEQLDAVAIENPGAGQEVAITMRMLGDAATITGLAYYAVGVPAAGASPGPVLCDGTFTLKGLWPGPQTVEFVPGFSDAIPTMTLHVNTSAGRVTDLGTVVLPTWIYEGWVHTDGESIGGARVELVSAVDWDGGWQIIHWQDRVPAAGAVTDDGGSFRVWLTSLPAGPPALLVTDTQDPARFVSQVFNGWPYRPAAPEAFQGDRLDDPDPWDDSGSPLQVQVAPASMLVTVLGGGGDPIGGMGVELLQPQGDGEWDAVAGSQTGDAGLAR